MNRIGNGRYGLGTDDVGGMRVWIVKGKYGIFLKIGCKILNEGVLYPLPTMGIASSYFL